MGKTSVVRLGSSVRHSSSLYFYLLLLATSDAIWAQEHRRPTFQPSFIIEPDALSDKDRAAIVEGLIKAQGTKSYAPLTVSRDQTLSQIIRDRYGFFSTKHYHTVSSISAAIKDASNLSDINDLKQGQELRLPVLPLRPFTTGANAARGQRLDLLTGQFSVSAVGGKTLASTFALGQEEPAILPKSGVYRSGSSWLVKMNAGQAKLFYSSLPDHIRSERAKYMTIDPGTEFTDVLVPKVNAVAENTLPPMAAQAPPTSLQKDISKLTLANMGKYYVLDFFRPSDPKKPCTHGALVLAAANRALDTYGATHLKDSIVPVELTFFGNKDQAIAEMLAYARRLGSYARTKIQANIDMLRKYSEPPANHSGNYVPLLYLQALYSNLITGTSAGVISSQFYITLDGFQILPADYSASSDVPLLTAVMDESGSLVEETLYEPIRSFRDNRHEYGLVLIGAVNAGAVIGMTSKNGDAVTTSYYGGVSGAAGGACANVSAWGTSFSTPQVGVQLILARALWKLHGEAVSAKEAQLRLLLATNVVPTFVQRYASGGVAQFEKLARGRGVHVRFADGSAAMVNAAAGKSFIKFRADPAFDTQDQRVFKRELGGFRAIQVLDGKVYVFWQDKMKWEPVKLDAVSFHMSNGTIVDVNDFISKIKEITLI